MKRGLLSAGSIFQPIAQALLIALSDLHVVRLIVPVGQHKPLVPRQVGATAQNIVPNQLNPKIHVREPESK